jgi:outer membrane protein assembly factor BamE
MRMFRPPLTLLAAALAAALPACGIPGLSPYRMEIQQGNYVSQETLSQLKVGMSKEQVRLALGTPLLTDLFHADRWDYVYYREATDRRRESRKMAVYFTDGKLARLDGAGISLEPQSQPAPPPATQAPAAPATKTPPAEETR